MPPLRDQSTMDANLRLGGMTSNREEGQVPLGKIPRSAENFGILECPERHAFSSHPCRTAYFTISMRPFKPSFRIALALWASTVLTLNVSRPAISLLL